MVRRVIGALIPNLFVPPRRTREKKRIQYQDVRERGWTVRQIKREKKQHKQDFE